MQPSDETRKLLEEKEDQPNKTHHRCTITESHVASIRLGFILCVVFILADHILLFLGGESISLLLAKQVTLKQHKPPRTVVSITTFGERVFHMAPCLNGIFSQTQKPDRIIVSIPKTHREKENTTCTLSDCASDTTENDESPVNILTWFKNYSGVTSLNETRKDVFEFPMITVQFIERDWGPATKVLGALLLESDPDTVIITMDDDMVYNRNTIEWLSIRIERKGMALAFGCEMWNNQHNEFKAFTTYSPSNIFVTSPRVCNGWLVGWTAVAHRVSNFGDDIWTYMDRLPKGCFYNDDIWVSGYVGRRGIVKVYAPWVVNHLDHRRDKDFSLSTIVGTRERNAFPCAREFFG